jgi:phytoene synthase
MPSNQPTSTDLEYVKRVVSDSGSSFMAGMRVLPQQRRDAMFAIYAFCREVDDIADEPGDIEERRKELDAWRAEINALYDGAPTREITRALAQPIAEYDLPKKEFLAVIDGMEMDFENKMRAPSRNDLTAYCRRVAVAVGLLSVRVFGAKGPDADKIALALGEALQYTNILRDLREDANLDRLYLPRETLLENGIESVEPDQVLSHPNLRNVCRTLAKIARARFVETRTLLDRNDRRVYKPSILMMEVYERILDALEREDWRDIDKKISISNFAKVWIVLRHGLV